MKNMADENFVSFEHLVGIYCNEHHYYAVEQKVSGGTNNNGVITNPSEIEFINTRIGVVSYEIDLNWCLGGWQSKAENNNKKVNVKITPKIGGSQISDPIEVEIPVTCSKYFLTNLPKYNNEGKIIDWSIEEIQLGNVTIQNNRCTITDGNENKTCVVSATEPVYNYGRDKHTDDLISVTLTNKFSHTTDATVNKVWYDDNNALGLRSDTYIQLWRRRKGTNVDPTKVGNDYVCLGTFVQNNKQTAVNHGIISTLQYIADLYRMLGTCVAGYMYQQGIHAEHCIQTHDCIITVGNCVIVRCNINRRIAYAIAMVGQFVSQRSQRYAIVRFEIKPGIGIFVPFGLSVREPKSYESIQGCLALGVHHVARTRKQGVPDIVVEVSILLGTAHNPTSSLIQSNPLCSIISASVASPVLTIRPSIMTLTTSGLR